MARRFAFLDTNIFLHYAAIDHVEWPELLASAEVVIVVTPVVIRELNRHKDFPSSPKSRERAAAALKKLHSWSDQSPPILVRKSVELQFRVKDSSVNFAQESLSRDIPDDHLIAAIIEFRDEHSSEYVTLVTADLGLKLKARAHGIPIADLPEQLRLPEQPDADQKRIRDLEQELRRLQHRVPLLKLMFRAGEERFHLLLGTAEELTSEDVARSMEGIRNKYPKMDRNQTADVLPVDLGLGIRSQEIIKYNEGLEKFYGKYQQHLPVLQDFRNLQQRIGKLELMLVNEGTCPAEDVDLLMHFPDGFQLVDQEHLPKKPPGPKPPVRPQSLREQLEDSMRMPSLLTNFSAHLPDIPIASNVSNLSIRRTKSYDVELNVRKVKHGFVQHLDPVYVIFESFENAHSFAIDYQIHAANVPDTSEGKVHVIVERLSITGTWP